MNKLKSLNTRKPCIRSYPMLSQTRSYRIFFSQKSFIAPRINLRSNVHSSHENSLKQTPTFSSCNFFPSPFFSILAASNLSLHMHTSHRIQTVWQTLYFYADDMAALPLKKKLIACPPSSPLFCSKARDFSILVVLESLPLQTVPTINATDQRNHH